MSRKFCTKSGGNSINKSLTIYLHAPCIHLSEDFTKSLKYLLFMNFETCPTNNEKIAQFKQNFSYSLNYAN